MKKKRFHWLGLGVPVIITTALVFVAGTATAAGIKKHITIPPSAFTPYTEDVAHSFGPVDADELPVGEFLKFEEVGDPDPTACFFAPITFQKGSMFFRKAWIYLSENPDPHDDPWFKVQVLKINLSEAYSAEIIAQKYIEDPEFSDEVKQFELDMSSQNEVISDKFAYQIRICISNGVLIHGAKVRMKK